MGKRIMQIVVTKKMNTVWLGYRILQPITHFTNAVWIVPEIVEEITQKNNLVYLPDVLNYLICVSPPQMQIGYD